jgi:hypothetical protein
LQVNSNARRFYFAPQRARAARRADALRSLAESILAVAGPPFSPPILPKATAAGFFFLCFGMSND